jgi:hypothetical protein
MRAFLFFALVRFVFELMNHPPHPPKQKIDELAKTSR